MKYKNIIILFFLFGSFWFGSHTLAADILDSEQPTTSHYLTWDSPPYYWRIVGQRFIPLHNNVSAVFIGFFSLGTSTIALCKGTPANISQVDVETNSPICGWAGNTLIHSEEIKADPANNLYKFSSPQGVDVGENYYFVHELSQEQSVIAGYYSGGSGMILNDSQWVGSLAYSIWYDDSYTPPPTPPQFTIQLLTPATTTPFTIYYSQPASYTFNYINPLNWYPRIRIDVRRKADARAAAWPYFLASGNFTTTSAASSTLTFGSASFKLPDGYYDLDAYFWANIPASPVHATTTFTINTGGSYGGYSFATSTLLTPPTFSTADLCGDIATSTIFGAIECGVLKAFVGAITWAFSPSFDTLTNFRVSFELFKGCFPFNTYFQLTETITNAANSTATSTAGTLKIPFIHTISGGGTFYMLDAVSSTTLSNWIGLSNYNLFRTTIGYFFWLIAAAVVFFTIKFI